MKDINNYVLQHPHTYALPALVKENKTKQNNQIKTKTKRKEKNPKMRVFMPCRRNSSFLGKWMDGRKTI